MWPMALKQRGCWTQDSPDALIFVTQSPDYYAPASANVLHCRLGLHDQCITYDVTHGCSGFVNALLIAGNLLQLPNIQQVLICGGDCSSLHNNPEDSATTLLFGDGCFGAVLEKNDTASEWHYNIKTLGSKFKSIMTPGWAPFGRNRHMIEKEKLNLLIANGGMNGMDVFTFSITDVPDAIKESFNTIDKDSLDWVFLHQANLFIMKHIARAIKIKMDKVPVSLNKYGNTSSASIPIGICDFYGSDTDETEKHLLLVGYGVGLAIGVMDIFVKPSVCLPIVKTTNFYEP